MSDVCVCERERERERASQQSVAERRGEEEKNICVGLATAEKGR
jgi:hypothetical protein